MDSQTLFELEKAGAIKNPRFHEQELVFDINFKIVKEQFPQHMEELVLQSLSDFERYWYEEGVMAYVVLEDGVLEWKRTRRKL